MDEVANKGMRGPRGRPVVVDEGIVYEKVLSNGVQRDNPGHDRM